MLILTRKVGDVICIGNDIEVMLTSVRGDGCVRLGISAPRHILVKRKELLGQLQEPPCVHRNKDEAYQ
jgi:carbon storage regulator